MFIHIGGAELFGDDSRPLAQASSSNFVPACCMASRNVALTFESGVPVYSGEPELLDEYFDRVEAIRVGYTEDTVKKFGGLGARLYNALRGEAYTAARGAQIPKAELVRDSGLEKLLKVVTAGVRPAGPTRTGELFKE